MTTGASRVCPRPVTKFRIVKSVLEKMHLLLQCPYVSRSSDLLQKRKDNFSSFDGTVRFYQSQLSRNLGCFQVGNDGIRDGYVCEGGGRLVDRRGSASFQQS